MQIRDARLPMQALPVTSLSVIDPLSGKEVRENSASAPFGYENDEAHSQASVEGMLEEIWGRVLNISYVSIYQNFFDLGGDALRSLEVLCLAEQKGLHFSLQQFVQHPTIHELAQLLQANS
jgi:aryl carrier-like protein